MLDLLMTRRSIRKYKSIEIEDEKIDLILKAALLSPSSRGICPWEFIVITDKTELNELSRCKQGGSDFLKDSSLGIVVLADADKSDVWIEDTSIASIIIQLEAQDLGLGSCWIQIRDRMHDENTTAEDYIRKLLLIPHNMRVESIISIGYPDENKSGHNEDELKYEKVHISKYGDIH